MVAWLKNYDAAGEMSGGAPDGNWQQTTAGALTVSGGKFLVDATKVNYNTGYIRRVASQYSDIRIEMDIAAGDFATGVKEIVIAQAPTTNEFLMLQVLTNGNPQFYIISNLDPILGGVQYLGPTNGSTASGFVVGNPHTIVVTKTGRYPMLVVATVYDTSVGPVGSGNEISRATVTMVNQQGDYRNWGTFQTPTYFGISAAPTTNYLIAGFRAYINTDLQAPVGWIQPQTTTNVNLTARFPLGGTGVYQYRWYRSASSFTPGAGGTLISSYSSSPNLQDPRANDGSTWYYACEMSDGVNSVFTPLITIVRFVAAATAEKIFSFGHSYSANQGASNNSQVPGTGTGMFPVAANSLATGVNGEAAHTVGLVAAGVSGSTCYQWYPGKMYLEMAVQSALAAGCTGAWCILQTNDTNISSANVGLMIGAIMDYTTTYLPYHIQVGAPPTGDGTHTLAKLSADFAVMKSYHDGIKRYVIGEDIMMRFNRNMTQAGNTAGQAGPGTYGGAFIGTDLLHPIDLGYQDLSYDVVGANQTARRTIAKGAFNKNGGVYFASLG